jgi:hypothetical protein
MKERKKERTKERKKEKTKEKNASECTTTRHPAKSGE